MVRIHVDTNALAEHRPAILVVPSDAPPVGGLRYVGVHCPCCGARTATVEQQGNTAHVIAKKQEQLVMLPDVPEKETP